MSARKVLACFAVGAALAAGLTTRLASGEAAVTSIGPGSAARVVTLITGERVALTAADARHATAAVDLSGAHRTFQYLGTGTAHYVIPDDALPYIGRQLDLSLFNVAQPPDGVQVDWAAGAARHAIPGVSARGQVTSAGAFPGALRDAIAL